MKKIFLLIAGLFPFFSFANISSFYIFYFTSSGNLGLNTVRVQSVKPVDIDTYLFTYCTDVTLGLELRSSSMLYGRPDFFVPLATNSAQSISYPFYDGDQKLYFSWALAPKFSQIYSLTIRLIEDGYSGSAVTHIRDNKYNFSPKLVLNEYLFGTNTTYRQTVINYLSSLTTSSSASVDSLQYLQTALQAYQDFRSLADEDIKRTEFPTMFFQSSSSDSHYVSDLLDSYPSFAPLARDALMHGFGDNFIKALNDYSVAKSLPGSPLAGKSFEDYLISPDLRRQSDQSLINASVVGPLSNELNRLRLDVRDQVTNELAKALSGIHSTLTNDDGTVGRSVNSINDVLGSVQDFNQNSGHYNIRTSIDTAGMPPIVVELNSPGALAESTWATYNPSTVLSVQNNGLLEWLQLTRSWYYDLWTSHWRVEDSPYHSNVVLRLDQIVDAFSFSNLLVEISQSLTNLTFSNSVDALLLTHYEQYINNGNYDSSLDSMSDDLLSLYARYGFKRDYGGIWNLIGTSLIINSDLQYSNVVFLSSINSIVSDYTNISSVISAFNSYSSDNDIDVSSPFSAGTRIISSLPSKTQIQDYIRQATNSVPLASVQSDIAALFDTVTNGVSLSRFYSESSFPSNLSIPLFDRSIQIPVSSHREIFDLLHTGVAFGLSILQFILLPRYLYFFLTILLRICHRFFVTDEHILR